MTTLTDYDDEELTYVYDASGNVLTMTDHHGNLTTYTYTDRNQVSTIRIKIETIYIPLGSRQFMWAVKWFESVSRCSSVSSRNSFSAE